MSVECPYCGQENELEYSDGEGVQEGQTYHCECYQCEKHFTYTTCISMSHVAEKSVCLNGGDHDWKQTHTHPWEVTQMRCTDCDDTREPTIDEWVSIHAEAGKPDSSQWTPGLMARIAERLAEG